MVGNKGGRAFYGTPGGLFVDANHIIPFAICSTHTYIQEKSFQNILHYTIDSVVYLAVKIRKKISGSVG